MKHEIEEYKGQTIYYDEHEDKFVCDIEFDGNVKSPKRGSLKDLKAAIDQFQKDNMNFKPFKAIHNGWGEMKVVEVVGIRTGDVMVIAKEHTKHKDHVRLDQFNKDYFRYDAGIIKELGEVKAEYDTACKLYNQKVDALEKRLKPINYGT